MERVNVIVPALNEPNLQGFLSKLRSYDVNVRDDKGLSFAVWKGLRQTKKNIIVVMDADGSHPTEVIPDMRKLLDEQIWLVIGSRYCKGGYSWDSISRKIVSLFYCKVAQIVLRTSISDSMSGFWVGYRNAFDFKPTGNFKFGLQLIRRYRKHIREYPIVFERRKEGKSHVRPMQALQDFFAIFRS